MPLKNDAKTEEEETTARTKTKFAISISPFIFPPHPPRRGRFYRRHCLGLFAFVFLYFLPIFTCADHNLLVDSELFSADIISQAFVQTGSELHYFRDISHHQQQQQQKQAAVDRGGGGGGGPPSAASLLVPSSSAPSPSTATANGSGGGASGGGGGGGGDGSKMSKKGRENGLGVKKNAAAQEEVVALFETESTDFGQSAFGVPVQRRVFVSNPTDTTMVISAITSSSISFHCSFVEQKTLASRQRTSFRVYFLPVLEHVGPQREVVKVHTSVGTFSHRVQGETVGNPYRIRSFLGIRLPLNATFSAPLSVHNPHTKTMVLSELFVSDCNVRIELNDGTTVKMEQQKRRGQEEEKEDKNNHNRRATMDWRFRPFETRQIGHAKVLGNVERNSTAFIVAKMRNMEAPSDRGGGASGKQSASKGGQSHRQKSDGILPTTDGMSDERCGGVGTDSGGDHGKKMVPNEQKQKQQKGGQEEERDTKNDGHGEEEEQQSFAHLLVVAISVQVTRRRGMFSTVDLLDFGLVRAGGGPVRPRTFSVYSSLERGVEIEQVYVEKQSRGVYLQFESRPPISIKSGATRGQPGSPVTVASVNIDTNTLLRHRHNNRNNNKPSNSNNNNIDEQYTEDNNNNNNNDDEEEDDYALDDGEEEREDNEQQQQHGDGTTKEEGDKDNEDGAKKLGGRGQDGDGDGTSSAAAAAMGHETNAGAAAGHSTMVTVRHGTVVAETRGGNYKVSIPFRATIYRGELEYDTEATAFHHALNPIVRREVSVTNLLPFGLAVWGVELAENATESFQASIISHPAVILGPGQSLPVLLLTYTQKQPANYISRLILHTNVTTFPLPITIFSGDLRIRLYAHKQNEFDFGSVGWDERRTILFSLSNPNPVALRLSRLHVPFPRAVMSLSFLGMKRLEEQHQQEDDNRSANVGQLVDTFLTNAAVADTASAGWTEGLDFALPAHTFALFNLTLCAMSQHRNSVPHNGIGTFRLQTQFGVYEFPLKFELVDFRLESVPSKIVFHDAFIGTVHTQPIKFFNTFPHDLHIHRLSIADADDDPRFQLFHQSDTVTNASTATVQQQQQQHQKHYHRMAIPPKSLLTVANVAFVPGYKCPPVDGCYLGIPLDTSDGQWFAYGMKLPQNLAEIDHYLYARLRQKWMAMGNQQRVVKTHLRMDTDRVKNLEVPIEGHLIWPRLLSHSVVHFPLTAVGNFTIVNLTLSNPTTNAVIVQLLPLVIYPDAEFLLDLFRTELPVPLPDPVEMNETLMFSLRDTELFTLRPGSPVPQLREEVEAILGGPVPRFTQTLLLRPGMSTRIRIGFLPNDYTLHSSLLLIRNNLTALEPVVLYGRGAKMHMDIDNKTARSQPLLFEIQPQHLADCANPRRQLHKLPTTLTVRRSFVVRNSGEVSFSVFNISVSNTACENRGFRVLNCDRFRLEPNETTLLDIAYTPDFLLTSNEATLQLYMHMNGTPWTFNLVATLPPHLLSVCHAALPRPPFESMMYYTCVLALTFCFICVVSCAYLEGDRVITCAYRQQFAVVPCPQDEKTATDVPSSSPASLVPSEEPNGAPSSATTALVENDDDLLPSPSRRTQFLQAAQDAGPLNKLFWRTLNFILCMFSYVWPLVRGGNKQTPRVVVGRKKAARKSEAAAAARKAAQQKEAQQQQQQTTVDGLETKAAPLLLQNDGIDGQRTRHHLGKESAKMRKTEDKSDTEEEEEDEEEEEEEEDDEQGQSEVVTTATTKTASAAPYHDDDDGHEDDEDDDDDVVQHPKDPEHLSNNNNNDVSIRSTKNKIRNDNDDQDEAAAAGDALDLSDPDLYMKFRSFLNAEKKNNALLLAKECHPTTGSVDGKKQKQQQKRQNNSASNSSTTTMSTEQRQATATKTNGTNNNSNSATVSLSKKRSATAEKKRRNNNNNANQQQQQQGEQQVVMMAPMTERMRRKAKNNNNKGKRNDANIEGDGGGGEEGAAGERGRHGKSAASTPTTATSSGSSSLASMMASPRGVSSSSTQTSMSSSSSSNSPADILQHKMAPPRVGGVRPEWFDRLFAAATTGAATAAGGGLTSTATTTASSTQQHNQTQQRRWPTTTAAYRAEEEGEYGTAFVWEQLYATKLFQFEEEEEDEDDDDDEDEADEELLEEVVDERKKLLSSNDSDEAVVEAKSSSSSGGDNDGSSSAAPEWADEGIADFATGSVDADFFALADQSAEFFDQISDDAADLTTDFVPQQQAASLANAMPPLPVGYGRRTRHSLGAPSGKGTTDEKVAMKKEEDEEESAKGGGPPSWSKQLLLDAENARIQRLIDTLTEEYRENLIKMLSSARNPMQDIRQLLDDLCLSPSTFKSSALPSVNLLNDNESTASLSTALCSSTTATTPTSSKPKRGTASVARLGNTKEQKQLRKSPGREFSARLRNGGRSDGGDIGTKTERKKVVENDDNNRPTTTTALAQQQQMPPSSYNTLFNTEDPIWKPIGPLDEQQHSCWPAQFMMSNSNSRNGRSRSRTAEASCNTPPTDAANSKSTKRTAKAKSGTTKRE